MTGRTDLSQEIVAFVGLHHKTQVLRTVLDHLDRRGVAALPVKGILLAPLLYADPLERPFGDVDLLIDPRDFLRILTIAKDAGWPLVWDSKQLGNVNLVVRDIAVDVEASVGPPGTSGVGVREVIRRSQRGVAPLGFPHLQIEVHDHALLMAVDTFKDKLKLKPWAREDLLRIATLPGFQPRCLVERARAAGLETMLAIVADWLLEKAFSSEWVKVRNDLPNPVVRPKYAQTYRDMTEALNGPPGWRLAWLARTVSDSPSRRIWAVALGAIGSAMFLARHGSLSASPWHSDQSNTTTEER
jgi:Uncharacterised nucleotidyltransferase